MKNPDQLSDAQDQLDEEVMPCPKCGKESKWGEIREFGTCLDCYYEEDKKRSEFIKSQMRNGNY